MRLPPEKIEEVRNAIDIVDLISTYLQLKKRGRNYVALCPFHHEKTPSFYVSPDRQMYHCFGCGASGNVFTFLMETEKVSFIESVKYLAEKAGIKLPEYSYDYDQKAKEQEELFQVMKFAANFYYRNLHETDEGKYPLEYLFKRGLKNDVIKTFALGYSLNKWDSLYKYASEQKISSDLLEKVGLVKKNDEGGYYDTFRGRIMFPIFSASGKILGFGARKLFEDDNLAKYINSPDTQIYNKSKVLYGLNFAKEHIRENDNVLLVEGYVDLLKTYQAGFKNVVASSGTALTLDQVRLISRYTKNITILYDADSAGVKATLRGIDLILENDMDVKIAPLPKGEDPDSFIEKYGKEKFENLIKNSIIFVDFMIDALTANGHINTPEGKTKVVRFIIQTLIKIKDPIKRNFYIKHIAEKYGIYESILLNEMDKLLNKEKKLETPIVYDNLSDEEGKLFVNQRKNSFDISVVEKDLLVVMLEGGNKIVDFVLKFVPSEKFSNEYSSVLVEILKKMESNAIKIEPSSVYDFVINEDINNKDDILHFLNRIIFSKYEISKHWEEIAQGISYEDALRIAKDCIKKLYKTELQKELERNQFLMREAQKRNEDLSKYLEAHADILKKIKGVEKDEIFSIE